MRSRGTRPSLPRTLPQPTRLQTVYSSCTCTSSPVGWLSQCSGPRTPGAGQWCLCMRCPFHHPCLHTSGTSPDTRPACTRQPRSARASRFVLAGCICTRTAGRREHRGRMSVQQRCTSPRSCGSHPRGPCRSQVPPLLVPLSAAECTHTPTSPCCPCRCQHMPARTTCTPRPLCTRRPGTRPPLQQTAAQPRACTSTSALLLRVYPPRAKTPRHTPGLTLPFVSLSLSLALAWVLMVE